MSHTVKERMRSREGVIASWALTAVAWVALEVMAIVVGYDSLFGFGLPTVSILPSLLIGAVAGIAMVVGITAFHSHPIAAGVPVFLAAPLALIYGVGGLIAVFWLILVSVAG